VIIVRDGAIADGGPGVQSFAVWRVSAIRPARQHSASELLLAVDPVWVATGALKENPDSALAGYCG
jgi:hypothetical protein